LRRPRRVDRPGLAGRVGGHRAAGADHPQGSRGRSARVRPGAGGLRLRPQGDQRAAGRVGGVVVSGAPASRGAHVWRGLLHEYRDRMPVTDATPIVTLREGGTPLIVSEVLSELTGCEVHLKYDGVNPTGSFKDRGMTVAIS